MERSSLLGESKAFPNKVAYEKRACARNLFFS